MLLRALLPLLLSHALTLPALATTSYTSVTGDDYSFTGIQETSSSSDPEPLFGQPTGSGNQLLFAPTTFTASSSGGGVDATGSQLQLTITALSPGTPILGILLAESGQTDLTGAGGSSTGTYASMSGFVTVTETTSGPISPVVIGFVGTFTPSETLLLPGDAGTTPWSGTAFIDVGAAVAGATKVVVSYNNDLSAFSEGEAVTTATVDKSAVSITVVPEPRSLLLVGVGLLGLALRGSRRSGVQPE